MAKIEDSLSPYNQSNFDIGATAALMRQLGAKAGVSEDDLAAAVPVFGDEHRAQLNSGYTEGSNYQAIAQRAVRDAIKAKGGTDPGEDAALVEQGRQQGQDRWKATQKPDSGMGGFAGMVGAALGAVFAPATFGLSAALGAALGGGAATLLTTGDPMKALVSGGISYLGGQLFSGMTGAAEGAGAVDWGSLDAGPGAMAVDGGGSGSSGLIGEQMNLGPTGAQKIVLADAGNTMTDVSPGYGDAGEMTSSLQSLSNPPPEPIVGSEAYSTGAGTGGKGLIGSVMDWAKENPDMAQAAGTVAGGALQVAGGVGAALLRSSDTEKQTAANSSMLDRRIQAEKDLQDKKVANAIELEEWKRKFAQAGSYFDSALPFKPAADTTLRRPGGAPVYKPGLIASAMA